MRKSFAVVLMLAVAVAAIPANLFAAAKAGARQQSGSLSGVAQGANKATLPNYTVRARNASTGLLAGSTTSTSTGSFSFAGLLPGTYVVEIVDAAGKVVGLSSSIGVAAGAAVSVTVTASAAAGAIAAAAGGGFGLLGLGTAASVAAIGAAGTLGVVAVNASRGNASPSR